MSKRDAERSGPAIFITGCRGIVGTVITEHLRATRLVTGADLPDDLAECSDLADRLHAVETVIHLARERNPPWIAPELRGRIEPRNVAIDVNVVAAVIEAGVPRLVMASSVHADDFRGHAIDRSLAAPGSYFPATPYGAYKLIGEEIGRVLARRAGFEFVALRLGGLTADDTVKPGPGRTATWLSHRDLNEAITACLSQAPEPGRATVFNVVSANADRVHDTTNPFGWTPRDDSSTRGQR